MRRTALVALAAALGGCGPDAGNGFGNERGGDPPANRQAGDQPLRPEERASAPCTGPIMRDDLENCDFEPAARHSGVWVTGFERSDYVPGGTGGRAEGDPGPPRAWLAFAPGVVPDPAVRAAADKLGTTAAVEIVFIGRRARPPGAVIVVDRIVSMRLLGPTRG